METMHAGEAWVSDGNFAQATFDLRLPRADLIIWLELPRSICLRRAIGRVFRPGEAHQLRDLRKVIRFIWNFDRINRPKIETARAEFGPDVPVMRLTSDAEVEGFLRQCRVRGPEAEVTPR
jgi:adenylate kinase family enzyme